MKCPVMQGAIADALGDGIGVEAHPAARLGVDPVDLMRSAALVRAYQVPAHAPHLEPARVVKDVAEDLRLECSRLQRRHGQ